MFSRFQSIVNKMRANKAQLPYDDHERALKLLHALDRRVWEVKVSAIIESPNYETLTVDELFSKLKSTEIDHQTRAKIENSGAPTMALVSGGGSASNPSPVLFALSSLLTITDDQVESLGDEELALVASRFTRFHNNRMSRRRGGSKDGCYNCGDPDHFVASCPKKGKLEAGPRDHHSGRRKGKRDTSSKHKSKGGFDKEALKRKYRQKAKIKERAFLASLSDLDHDSDESASASSDEEVERHVEDKLNGLCFFAGTAGGLCTMALGEDAVGTSNDKDIGDDTTSEVLPFADDLAAEVEELTAALASQDKLLRQAARDRREFRSKYESTLRELESARASVVVSDETECDECALHMSNITTLQTKYATLLDERDELRSRSSLLGVCTVCPGLQTELAERDARIALLEKASSVSAPAPVQCALCEGLQSALESCRHDKTRIEEENTYLRSVLSWVSCSEPQLGMMVSQFKRGTGGPGLGFAAKDGSVARFGKVGECSGLTPSEKPSSTPKLIKITPPKPITPVRDGVIEEPVRAPPQKQVWLPKPNHLRNTLDTLPGISSDHLPRAPQPSKKKAPSHKQNPPKREVRYHCEYCERDGHLASFCFRRKRDERRVSELSRKDMNRPSHGVHAQSV